jgi:DoxX-like protein
MEPSTSPAANPKWMLWTGRVLSALPILLMAGGGIAALIHPAMMTEGLSKYGYPPEAGRPIVIAEIACALVYAIPQTSILGAILLTGYLGGATATHVHAGEPFIFPIIFGIIVWLGVFFREPRLRALVPFRH